MVKTVVSQIDRNAKRSKRELAKQLEMKFFLHGEIKLSSRHENAILTDKNRIERKSY